MSGAYDEMIEMLLARLERVPADSVWAHRASGLRGSLLDALEDDRTRRALEPAKMKQLMEAAFAILEAAATEKGRTGSGSGSIRHGVRRDW